jgi:hypothetical protein
MEGATNHMVAPDVQTDSGPWNRFSDDGWWWWDGRRWMAAVTGDGLWSWDGTAWKPTVDFGQMRPIDLAATLTLLAEDRFAQAAEILVARVDEWRPASGLVPLIRAATAQGKRPRRVADDDWGAALEADRRSQLVRLGRAAPRPTMADADGLLEPARFLDARAGRLTEAVLALEAAEREHALAIEVAQRDLDAARAARERAVGPTRRRLMRALIGDPGSVLAEAGPLRAHADVIATPAGRLPVLGLVPMVGTAHGLWIQHQALLADLVLTETAEGIAYADCLMDGADDLFVVLAARSRTLLWRCPTGQERLARHLVRVVRRRAAESAAEAGERTEDEVAPLVERCRQLDHEVKSTYEQARVRLANATWPPPELAAARQRVDAEQVAIETPPPPLA